MKKILLLFTVLICSVVTFSCSSDDDSNQSEPTQENDFYTVTLRLQGIPNAGYNTSFSINTFHENHAELFRVYEHLGDIQWENGIIEHTFTVDAKLQPFETPLTSITCGVGTTLHQEYEYAIDHFTFTAILKNSEGNIISELSTNQDTVDGWLSFTSNLVFEL